MFRRQRIRLLLVNPRVRDCCWIHVDNTNHSAVPTVLKIRCWITQTCDLHNPNWDVTRVSQMKTLNILYLVIYWTQNVHSDFILLCSIVLPPVGHSSNHQYHCCQLTIELCFEFLSNFFKVCIWISIVLVISKQFCYTSFLPYKKRRWPYVRKDISKYVLQPAVCTVSR